MNLSRGLRTLHTALLIALVLDVSANCLAAPGADSRPVKIAAELAEVLETQEQADVFVVFGGGTPDLSPAYEMSWEERGEFVVQALQDAANRTQAQVRALLDARGIEHQSFIIDNTIFIRGASTELVAVLAALPEVSLVRSPFHMPTLDPGDPPPSPGQPPPPPNPPETCPSLTPVWNVAKINADDLWRQNIKGQGIVVASLDTGVKGSHSRLSSAYRGGASSWFDATGVYPSGPGDNVGHGTHVMGTMVGASGIGVAPGAKWIACKVGTSTITEADFNECADWILHPGGDTSMRPHVVNNSWGDAVFSELYRAKIAAWTAAGIYPVFSAGNLSTCLPTATCSAVATPATYKEVTAVGATDSSDRITCWSAWGPTKDPTGAGETKPEVVAPGDDILSAYYSDASGCVRKDGTSMAAPHVAGAVALFWSACPAWIGKVAETERKLKNTAVKIAYTTGCAGESAGSVPNNAYGYGRIDAWPLTNPCATCGNGWREPGESCEGSDLGGATCVSLGYDRGTLSCSSSCTYNTSQCIKCGNGKKESGEECDGADLGGATCTGRGCGGGSLSCTASCQLDYSRCTACPACPETEGCDGKQCSLSTNCSYTNTGNTACNLGGSNFACHGGQKVNIKDCTCRTTSGSGFCSTSRGTALVCR